MRKNGRKGRREKKLFRKKVVRSRNLKQRGLLKQRLVWGWAGVNNGGTKSKPAHKVCERFETTDGGRPEVTALYDVKNESAKTGGGGKR